MKTFFRVTVLGLLMVMFTAVSVSPIMAQGDDQKEKTALYNKFVAHFDKETIEDKKIALAVAKEYNSKFNKEIDKQYNDYFKEQIKYLEEWIAYKEAADKAAEEERIRKAKLAAMQARLKAFSTSLKTASTNITADNWNDVFSAGQAVIDNDKQYSEYFRRLLAAAGSIYLVESKTPIDAFNNKVISYAEQAIQDIESGKPFKNEKVYPSLEFDTKEEALGKLNIIIANIKANRQGKKEEGMAYYYKSLDHDKNWNAYRIIGDWYKSKAAEIGDVRTKLDQKDEANIPKIREYVAMEKGYVARAIDAYARSYSLAKSNPKVSAEAKTALYDILKNLFAFRYPEPEDAAKKTEASINTYVATIGTKSMPSPQTDVEPIKSNQELREEREAKANETKTDETKKDGADKMKDAETSVKTNGATRTRTVVKKDN